MASAWERALARGEGQAAKSKVKYEDLTPAGRARIASSVTERNVAMAPPPKPPTPQSAPQRPTRALPTGTPLVPMTRTPSPEEYEQGYKQAGQFAEAALFGPQVESALRDNRQAGYLERFFRTQAGEQEFRTSGERFGEGRPAAGAGWGLLGLAGAIPFFGDIAQGAAGVSRAARGAGAAADVARGAPSAKAQSIVNQASQEILNTGAMNYTVPNIESYPEARRNMREIMRRQNFDAPPTVIERGKAEQLASQGYQPVYRGMHGADKSAIDYANDFVSGDVWVSHGQYGNGIYVSSAPEKAASYAIHPGGGAAIRAYIPPDANILDLPNIRTGEYANSPIIRGFKESPFTDIGDYLASLGYDGVRIGATEGEMVIFNRSILLVEQPINVPKSFMNMQLEQGIGPVTREIFR
jgi:hypothetical protein